MPNRLARNSWSEAISIADCRRLIPPLLSARGQAVSPAMLQVALPARGSLAGAAEEPHCDATELRNILARLGLQTRVWQGRACKVQARQLPCLCFSECGLQLVERPEDIARGLFFLPVTSTGRAPGMAHGMAGGSWSWQLLRRYLPLWRGLLAMSFGVQLVALLVPLLTMVVYDRIAGAAALTDLGPLAFGLCLIVAGETWLRRLRLRLVAFVAARLDHLVNTGIMERLLQFPPTMIESASVSAQVARLRSFEAIREFFGSPLFLNLFELPSALLMLLAVYLIAGPLAVVPLLMVGVYGIAFLSIRPLVRQRLDTAGAATAARQELLLEMLREPAAIRADGMAALFARRGAMLSARAVQAGRHAGRLTEWLEHGASYANAMAGLITLTWGVERVLDGQLSQGALLASMLLTWRLLAPLAMFCTTLPRFAQMALAFRQLDQLQAVAVETDGRIRPLPQPRLRGTIEFERVGMRYGSALSESVLQDFSLRVAPGESIAIMGANGVGKSTLLKLLPGLQKLQAGAIRIDGIDIRQFDMAVLRRIVAYMPQQPDLFTGSVMTNLRLANVEATEADYWTALEAVGAADEVRALSEGLTTGVGRQGSWAISPSLAYRIGLARLLLRQAPILLLDELPLPFLEGENERAYRNLLTAWRGHRTVMYVTHRRDHALLADRIVYLQGAGHTPVTLLPRDLQSFLADLQA